MAIAPFVITKAKVHRIPCRALGFLGMWGGDRPEILIDGDRDEIWRKIVTFLLNDFTAWDILDLSEQPLAGPAGNGWDLLARPGLQLERNDDAVDYYVPLEGTFDDYLKCLSANTRSDWRRKTRRLKEHLDRFEIECVSTPEQMQNALGRFVDLERLGWKIDAGVAAGQSESHLAFYGGVIAHLAQTGEVEFYFLKGNATDVACVMNFYHRDVAYMRHTIYNPAFADFSPGIVLLAEVIGRLFGCGYKEYDLLGMRESSGPQRYKLQWGKGRRDTVQWVGYRAKGRLLPWLAAKKLKSLILAKSASQAA
ncbi:MAG: GNAT family N-acetyltransferase [Thiotrichales bacterium]